MKSTPANFDLLCRATLSSSDVMHVILGLHLLYLLVENKLTEFHCELELLNDADRAHPAIQFCTRLDQHLMVGSYDQVCSLIIFFYGLFVCLLSVLCSQVLAAAGHPPIEHFKFFLTSLLETVRINIGYCAASSYRTLSIASARGILMFDSEEVCRFVMCHVFATVYKVYCSGNKTISDQQFRRVDHQRRYSDIGN
jgi:26S proteasome regulatory subunit N12